MQLWAVGGNKVSVQCTISTNPSINIKRSEDVENNYVRCFCCFLYRRVLHHISVEFFSQFKGPLTPSNYFDMLTVMVQIEDYGAQINMYRSTKKNRKLTKAERNEYVLKVRIVTKTSFEYLLLIFKKKSPVGSTGRTTTIPASRWSNLDWKIFEFTENIWNGSTCFIEWNSNEDSSD